MNTLFPQNRSSHFARRNHKVVTGFLSTVATILAASMLFLAPGYSAAESYPERTITLVVPFPAGGPADFVARLYAKEPLGAS